MQNNYEAIISIANRHLHVNTESSLEQFVYTLSKCALFVAPTDLTLSVLWFFPYFMEKRIVDSFKDFQMLDYKVKKKIATFPSKIELILSPS